MTKNFSGLCRVLKGYTNLKLFFSEMKVISHPPPSVYWGINNYFPTGKIKHGVETATYSVGQVK